MTSLIRAWRVQIRWGAADDRLALKDTSLVMLTNPREFLQWLFSSRS